LKYIYVYKKKTRHIASSAESSELVVEEMEGNTKVGKKN